MDADPAADEKKVADELAGMSEADREEMARANAERAAQGGP